MSTEEPQLPQPAVEPAAPIAPRGNPKRLILRILTVVVVIVVLIVAAPWVMRLFSTVSTDDAYVNGHVTFVAPRIAGQVVRVLVDDNNRVHKGDPLVQLDKEPYQVQVDIAQASVSAAETDLIAARAM